MSFREKSAWITLITVLVCFGAYYGSILAGVVTPRGFRTLHLLLLCVIVLAVLQFGLGMIAARTTPMDSKAPGDEREKLIQARSHTIGYYALIVLVLGLGIPVHLLGVGVFDLMNFALLDVVLAVVIVAVAQIVMFRRGI